jgi:hypothetical protein
MAKTTFRDIATAESRDYERSATYSAVGRSYCYITCPFCRERVKVYIWSLAGGGKRCPCGALHGSLGATYKKAETKEPDHGMEADLPGRDHAGPAGQ